MLTTDLGRLTNQRANNNELKRQKTIAYTIMSLIEKSSVHITDSRKNRDGARTEVSYTR